MPRFNEIDPLQPLAALGVEDVIGTQPVSGGMDALLWRVDTPRGSYALRLFRPDQRGQCTGEVRAMQIAGALDVPVPRIAAHGAWGDRPAILMEWCEGRPILDAALDHFELCDSLGRSMGRLQARMHAISLPESLCENHRRWLNRAGPGEDQLRARLLASGLRDGHILHLDFHPLNILCRGGQATVILDWANATVGDPHADVARTLSIFRLIPPPPGPDASRFAAAFATLERAWLEGYAEVAGPLPDLALFDVWAGAYFVRDLAQHVGKPGFWLQPADFDRIRESNAALRRAVGLAESPSAGTSHQET